MLIHELLVVVGPDCRQALKSGREEGVDGGATDSVVTERVDHNAHHKLQNQEDHCTCCHNSKDKRRIDYHCQDCVS